MNNEKINKILSAIKVPFNHPLFFSRAFALVAKNRHAEESSSNPIQQIFSEEYEELSRHLDRSQIQESCSVRNILRSRSLAGLLIDDKGELQIELLPKFINECKAHLYSIGPARQYDAKRQDHILKVLERLQGDKELVRLLKKISKPFSNKNAEEIIRHTLQLPLHTPITDAHARRAVLAAWLSYLRQNVGSCFATAPAKIVHDEQPELFLQDISDLLAVGRLKRTFGGVEYSVPLSISWGAGDLKKPLFIRRSTTDIKPEIWYSPGLMAAFEAIDFLKKEDSTRKKIELIKNWLVPILLQKSRHQPLFVMNAEELIYAVMLQLLGLTEQDLKDYENRPKGLVQSHLLMQIPITTGKISGGIGERCAHFLHQFEVAKNTFKALSDNALLKSWEFTLASFSETKFEFTRWNLYASLGMGTNEPGGIGQCIYQIVQRKLDVMNKAVEEAQYEYEMVYTQIKTLESRMRHVSTDKEMEWLKVEYQSLRNEFFFLEERRDETQHLANSLVGLYDSLYQLYLDLFKDYFQEVYDADLQEVVAGPFDDSPAGFRLLYKHGRSNTSQWTPIKNSTEFIDALVSFFVATEPQIAASLESKRLEKDLSEIITSLINHVKTKEFLESAFYRMAAAHKVPLIQNPLDHLDQVEKKPWVYTSGGTMNTLVSCYYHLEEKPAEDAKWVESEMELLVFLADTLKRMPQKFLDPYLKGSRIAMLMQSPTHAFILKPTLAPFKEAWMNEEFTYTFIRDRFVQPAETFISFILLNDEMIQFIVQQLAEKVPENFQPRFRAVCSQLKGPLNPILLREYLVDLLEHDRGLSYGKIHILHIDEIDSAFYSHLPFFPLHELKDRLYQILILLPQISEKQIQEILNLLDHVLTSKSQQVISAKQLQDICKALLCLSGLRTTAPVDYHLAISLAAQKRGFAMPAPLIFADTNWVKDDFAFVVNPGTGLLDLWRVDYTGSAGYPMSSWKEWLDGSRPDQKWGIYIKPPQYGQS